MKNKSAGSKFLIGLGGLITVALSMPPLLRADDAAKPPAPADKSSSNEKSDGTVRQTAHPWDGAPTGPGDAFETPGRDQLLRIEHVMDEMKIGPGAAVGDIGAGGGWFTVRAARRVGPKGMVYAEDILPTYTAYIAKRAQRAGLKNVRTILGTVNDPKLPGHKLDAVLFLNAYHEFAQPLDMLRKVRAALKPGGRLAFIERDNDDLRREARDTYAKTGQIKRRVDDTNDNNPYTDDHRLAREIVEREAASVGFRQLTEQQLGEDNYLVVVERGR